VALGEGQAERLGQGGQRAGLLAPGGEGERLQDPHLDQAAGPPLGGGQAAQPLQQGEGLRAHLLGQQHPGQDQVAGLARVARLVVGSEPARPGPAGGVGDLAPGEGEAGPQRRHRVEQADPGGARLDDPLGLGEDRQGGRRSPWAYFTRPRSQAGRTAR